MGLIRNVRGRVKALVGLARLTKDPTRLDEVFSIAEGFETVERAASIAAAFKLHPQHEKALKERPRIGHVKLTEMAKHAPGTLGRAVHDELSRLGIDPEDMVIPEVKTEFDYVRAHMRESHDIWHVVTGFDTDVAGELGLQAFYFAQFRAPLPPILLAIGMLNTLLYQMDDGDRRLRAIARGWLLGRSAETLFGVRWRELFDVPLVEVRRRLNLDLVGVDAALQRFDPVELRQKKHVWGAPLTIAA